MSQYSRTFSFILSSFDSSSSSESDSSSSVFVPLCLSAYQANRTMKSTSTRATTQLGIQERLPVITRPICCNQTKKLACQPVGATMAVEVNPTQIIAPPMSSSSSPLKRLVVLSVCRREPTCQVNDLGWKSRLLFQS